MADEQPPGRGRHFWHIRSQHPLVKLMRKIRKRHKCNLPDVEACMEIPFQTLKQIEEGRRPLPGLQEGPGPAIGPWIQRWMECVHITEEERKRVEDLLMATVLGRLGENLS